MFSTMRATHYIVTDTDSHHLTLMWPNHKWADAARYAAKHNVILFRGTVPYRQIGVSINKLSGSKHAQYDR